MLLVSKESKHRLEGSSLIPLINGTKKNNGKMRYLVKLIIHLIKLERYLIFGASDARGYMIRTNKWKYIYYKGFPPQLFDLINDPEEFKDLGQEENYSKTGMK